MEPSNREILDAVVNLGKTIHGEILDAVVNLSEAIQGLATHVDERFNRVDERFSNMDKKLEGMDQRLIRVESTMVTKSYLDDKLADLRADLITLARKQNRKLEAVVEEFVSQGHLTRAVADRLLALEPFPQ